MMLFAVTRPAITAAVCLIAAAACARAETPTAAPLPERRTEGPRPAADASRTGKERLGQKWTDEQRTDDCNVPPEKRAGSVRPDCKGPAK